MNITSQTLHERLSSQAERCRNDGASGLALLLDEAAATLRMRHNEGPSGERLAPAHASTATPVADPLALAWHQEGFAVVSRVSAPGRPDLPMVHGFFLPEWQATGHLASLAALPQELREDAAVVRARLTFQF